MSIMLTTTPANATLVTPVMIVKLKSMNASRLLVSAVSMFIMRNSFYNTYT